MSRREFRLGKCIAAQHKRFMEGSPIRIFALLTFVMCFSSASEAQQISLFNGTDLTGWAGLPNIWSVRDGAITGDGPGGDPAGPDFTSLIWQGGKVSDFELTWKIKLTGKQGPGYRGSGLQFRGSLLDPNKFTVAGYTAAMNGDDYVTGCLNEIYGRNYLIKKQKAALKDNGNAKNPQVAALGAFDDISVKREAWNDYKIRATGNRIQLFFNGRQSVDMLDLTPAAARSGLLSVGFNHRSAMTVQFKDIFLTPLPPPPNAAEEFGATPAARTSSPVALPPVSATATIPTSLPPTPAAPTSPVKPMSRTPSAGGQSGKDFSETQPEGGILVGLEVWKGDYYRSLVIGGIRAVYQTEKGRVRGQVYGRGNGDPDTTIVAGRERVSIVRIEATDDGQQVIALRVSFANGEQSPWFGREVPNLPLNKMPKNLHTTHLVAPGPKGALGIYGGADGMLFRLGLIY